MSTTTEPTAPKTLKEATALLSERETALTAAEQKLASLEASHSEAIASLTTERDSLKAQFDSAVEAAAKSAEELAAVRGEFESEKAALRSFRYRSRQGHLLRRRRAHRGKHPRGPHGPVRLDQEPDRARRFLRQAQVLAARLTRI